MLINKEQMNEQELTKFYVSIIKEEKDVYKKRAIIFVLIGIISIIVLIMFKENDDFSGALLKVLSMFGIPISIGGYVINSTGIKRTSAEIKMATNDLRNYLSIKGKYKKELEELEYSTNKYKMMSNATCPHCNYKNPFHVNVNNESTAKIKYVREADGTEHFYCHSCYNSFGKQ